MGVGFLGVGFLGTCLSWVLLVYFGRRRIYNVGLAVLAILQIIIGILDCAPNWANRPGIIWTESSLLVIWNFFYDLTVSPESSFLNVNDLWTSLPTKGSTQKPSTIKHVTLWHWNG